MVLSVARATEYCRYLHKLMFRSVIAAIFYLRAFCTINKAIMGGRGSAAAGTPALVRRMRSAFVPDKSLFCHLALFHLKVLRPLCDGGVTNSYTCIYIVNLHEA